MSIRKVRKLVAVPTYDKTLKPTPEAIKELAEKFEAELAAQREAEARKAEENILVRKVEPRTPEQIIESLTHRVKEVETMCYRVHKPLLTQIMRTSTLTEVSRFLGQNAPEEAYAAIQKLLTMCDNDDDWWNERRDTAVWQWACELVPKYAAKWRKAYDTKYGAHKQ